MFARGILRRGIGPHKEPGRWQCKVRRSQTMKTGQCPRRQTKDRCPGLKGSHQKRTSCTSPQNRGGVPLAKLLVAKGEGDPQSQPKKPRNRLCDPPHHPSPIPFPNPASPHMTGAPGEKPIPVGVLFEGNWGIGKGNAPMHANSRG